MADLSNLKQLVLNQVVSVGRAALSGLFPRDFEYYMVALELTTFEGDTIDFFSFPIMPSQISKSENVRTSVYSTLGGITVINSDTFTPQDLTITGDFGRAFKIVLGDLNKDAVTFRGVKFSNSKGVYYSDEVNAKFNKKIPDFNFALKSGYGCLKMLQSIINRAISHDEGRSFRLYFYNLGLGESYLVVPTKTPLTMNMNENKNMIWNYTLNLQIVAPLDRIEFGVGGRGGRSLSSLLAQAVVQNAVNNAAQTAAKYAKSA